MTNEQILKKAIERAIKSKYMPIKYTGQQCFHYITVNGLMVTFWERTKWSRRKECPKVGLVLSMTSIIFSHDFAKAFWKSKKKCYYHEKVRKCNYPKCSFQPTSLNVCGYYRKHPKTWQYHLQHMVLELEPLKYLEKFLNEEKK